MHGSSVGPAPDRVGGRSGERARRCGGGRRWTLRTVEASEAKKRPGTPDLRYPHHTPRHLAAPALRPADIISPHPGRRRPPDAGDAELSITEARLPIRRRAAAVPAGCRTGWPGWPGGVPSPRSALGEAPEFQNPTEWRMQDARQTASAHEAVPSSRAGQQGRGAKTRGRRPDPIRAEAGRVRSVQSTVDSLRVHDGGEARCSAVCGAAGLKYPVDAGPQHGMALALAEQAPVPQCHTAHRRPSSSSSSSSPSPQPGAHDGRRVAGHRRALPASHRERQSPAAWTWVYGYMDLRVRAPPAPQG